MNLSWIKELFVRKPLPVTEALREASRGIMKGQRGEDSGSNSQSKKLKGGAGPKPYRYDYSGSGYGISLPPSGNAILHMLHPPYEIEIPRTVGKDFQNGKIHPIKLAKYIYPDVDDIVDKVPNERISDYIPEMNTVDGRVITDYRAFTRLSDWQPYFVVKVNDEPQEPKKITDNMLDEISNCHMLRPNALIEHTYPELMANKRKEAPDANECQFISKSYEESKYKYEWRGTICGDQVTCRMYHTDSASILAVKINGEQRLPLRRLDPRMETVLHCNTVSAPDILRIFHPDYMQSKIGTGNFRGLFGSVSSQTKESTDARDVKIVTDNGDIITNARIYQVEKRPGHWCMVADKNGVPMKPKRISIADLVDYWNCVTSIDTLVQKYYWAHMRKTVDLDAYKYPCPIMMTFGIEKTLEKFGIQKNPEYPCGEKYLFYAVISGKEYHLNPLPGALELYFLKALDPVRYIEEYIRHIDEAQRMYAHYKIPEAIAKDIKVEVRRETDFGLDSPDYSKRFRLKVTLLTDGHQFSSFISKNLYSDDFVNLTQYKCVTKEQLIAKHFASDLEQYVEAKSRRDRASKLKQYAKTKTWDREQQPKSGMKI